MEAYGKLRLTALTCGMVVALALGGSPVWADRGAIRTVKKIDIEEPAQRAIIAYNGVREVLILQTDVRAAEETKVVEFMPLPSKPKVSLAPEGCFAELAKLVEKHRLRYVSRSRRGRKANGEEKGDAVKVVVAAQLGPHAVTVVEVKDADAFVRWVKDFFRKNDLGEPDLADDLRAIVSDYLSRNLRFFAFDVVTMSPEKKTVRPLTYEFKSDRLYYPLKVTNLYGGTGVIELFVIAPWRFVPRGVYDGIGRIQPAGPRTKIPGTALDYKFMTSNIALLKGDETRGLHRDIPGMMWEEEAHIMAVRYEGPLRFDADVWGSVGCASSNYLSLAFFRALWMGNAEMLESLVSVPFAFDGREVVTEKAVLMKKFEEVMATSRLRLGKRGADLDIVEMPVRGYRFVLRSPFDRKFVEDQLLDKDARVAIVGVTVGGEDVVLFLRSGAGRVWKVVGFSD
ncbi:MAG: hypothetical protein AMS16_06990 [Planctomycetes bacterium DG_58]|nr:MAG: hypothetical protein AMS16_06990 [Planctomycetes bacterium DG_58]KPK96771.1 MAG: hypothetical protein AMK75_07900 [Planctomycetes bacterium SM23_65]